MLYRLLPLMDMFFMISGFLILLRYGETLTSVRAYRSFLVRRLARFYPLYLVTFLFFVLVGMALHAGLVSSTQPGRYDPGFLWQNLALVQAWGTTDHLSFNYVAWSLSAEWFCYLLLPVFVLVIRHAGWKGLAALALAAIALLEAATEAGVIPFSSWLLADTFGAYRAFADFALGGLVMLLVRQSRWQLQKPSAGLERLRADHRRHACSSGPPSSSSRCWPCRCFLPRWRSATTPTARVICASSAPLGAVSFASISGTRGRDAGSGDRLETRNCTARARELLRLSSRAHGDHGYRCACLGPMVRAPCQRLAEPALRQPHASGPVAPEQAAA